MKLIQVLIFDFIFYSLTERSYLFFFFLLIYGTSLLDDAQRDNSDVYFKE